MLDFLINWTGPILVVVSLAVPNVMWFRWLNLTGSTLAAIVAAVDSLWPFVFMNGAIALINVFWLWRLIRARREDPVKTLVSAGRDTTTAGMWGASTEAEAKQALAKNPSAYLALVVHDKAVTALAVLAPSSTGKGEDVLWTMPASSPTAEEVKTLASSS